MFQAERVRRREGNPLGPRGCEHEHRALRLREHPLEHLDQRLGGPVHVLDDQHRGSPRADSEVSLTHSSCSCEKRRPRVEITADIEAERQAEHLAAGEPLQHVLGRVLLPQSELLAQHVGERAVGHAAAVGEAATEPKRGRCRQPLPERADEARLAHARFTHDGGEPRAPFRLRAREQVLEPLELALAAHETRLQAVAAAWPPRSAHPPQVAADDAALLALRRDRPRLAEFKRAADERRGALAHERVARLGRLLEARGHVHRVAGREGAALARAADHDLAGVDADPQREPAAEELLQPLLHPQGDLQRPLGVVLLGGGRAEHGDDRVADELLDRSPAERDLRLHRVVEAVEQIARVLRVERRAQLRRADEVGEQDRRELALHRGEYRSHLAQGQPAAVEAARRQLRFGIRPHAITRDTTADKSVVIVGGGAAGTLTASHLLRAGAPGPVVVVEREDRLARGVAYSTTFPRHLMNVVAANLGGICGRPEHLLEWLAEQGEPVAPGDFVLRMTFGRYLSDLLAQADAAAPGVLETVRGAVVDVARQDDRARVALADGRTLAAAHVVLATGTPTSRDVPVAGGWPQGSPRYVHDPWAPGALALLAPGDDLLLVGTGLTMVDVALRLVAERPDVRLVGLSRTGLLPIPHRWPQGPVEPRPPAAAGGDVAARAGAGVPGGHAGAAGRGGDARDVVDAMRPYTQAIWKGFSPAEQRRALRAYTRVWAINRNRMAPAAWGWIEELRGARCAHDRGRHAGRGRGERATGWP